MLRRWEIVLLAFVSLLVGCSERLTPSRAGTIIRHSNAFLSGSPESQPVFDGVTSLLSGSEGRTGQRQEDDFYVAEFSYHWRPDPKSRVAGSAAPALKASVVLRRAGNGWAVDDQRSRALVPSWPQLPREPDSFWPGAQVRP